MGLIISGVVPEPLESLIRAWFQMKRVVSLTKNPTNSCGDHCGTSRTVLIEDRCGTVVFRMTPFEWEFPHPIKPGDNTLENSMTLLNCLWFSIGSVLCAGCEILPKWAQTIYNTRWWCTAPNIPRLIPQSIYYILISRRQWRNGL